MTMADVLRQDTESLAASVQALLSANQSTPHFCVDLTVITRNTELQSLPRRKVFAAVSDILASSSFISKNGSWVLAEVEMSHVQFCKTSTIQATLPEGWKTSRRDEAVREGN